MSAPVVLAALAAATAVALAGARPQQVTRRPPARSTDAEDVDDRAALLRLRPVVAPLVVLGGWLLLGGVLGALVGGVGGVLAWRVLGNSEGPAARRRRERLALDLPLAVELLGACVRSGAAAEGALETVADALGGPMGEELRAVHHRLRLGSDPVTVWRRVQRDPMLAPLGRAVARSHESGASVAEALDDLSADLREQGRTELVVRANSVEVKAAAPLGVCFLPAFVLLGIVPLVVGGLDALVLLD